MKVREAAPEDNDALQDVQASCPMGTTVVVSTVNTPDFFARARAYESPRVFVACEEDQIMGSAACAIRDGVVNGDVHRVGLEFQYFTHPNYRRRGLASLLHRTIEEYFTREGVSLSYVMVRVGNLPAMRLFEREGFKEHRTMVMPALAVYREMDARSRGEVRPAASSDLPEVAELLNQTWDGYDLYEPTSAEGVARFVERTPQYSLDNLLVLEDEGRMLACLGFWDRSRITQSTVLTLSRRVRMMGLGLKLLGYLRAVPPFVKPGKRLKQLVLTPIGFKAPAFLQVLVRYLNNQALRMGIEQICCICEQDHPLLTSMRGFMRVDTAQHLYIKPLEEGLVLGDNPVFADGTDL